MKRSVPNKHAFFKLLSAVILLAGLTSAAIVYWTARDDDPFGALGYRIIGGSSYPIMPQDTKVYRHDLEVFGGKAAVLADHLRLWFNGLWHGRSLAWTIAFLTILLSLCFYLAGDFMRAGPGAQSDPGQ